MTKVFLLPTAQNTGNEQVISQITEAAKNSPLLLVLPKQLHSDETPPEPPMAA